MKKVLAIFLSFAICLGQIPVNSVKAETSTTNGGSSNIVTVRFDYTGGVQEFTAPRDGEYTLTVAGAQGGQGKNKDSSSFLGEKGGLGGISTGKVNLTEGQKIFICVGGTSDVINDGGYNGGGSGPNNYSFMEGSSGGGATHIATYNRGILAKYKDYKNEVLIVAGGGGGGYLYTGGAGGGATGEGGSLGGTQTSGGQCSNSYQKGSFGNGGGKGGDTTGAGGGGGWYGGAAYSGAGGGGSGYIGGVTDGSMTTGTNEGNGWATISYKNNVTIQNPH